MDVLVLGLVGGSMGCLAFSLYPLLAGQWRRMAAQVGRYQLNRVEHTSKVLDDMFMEVKPVWLIMAYRVAPLAAALLLYVVLNNLLIAAIGALLSLLLPDALAKLANRRRQAAFNGQLLDMLFMLSSSLRAGLSLTQAFEVLETEMSPPASQEFGLMMKAHRVGMSLDEALLALNRRMASEELNLIVTAMLMARSTGGDVTRVIGQLIGTIREKKKLNEKVLSLTLQGKLQALIMSLLPIGFAISVRQFNKDYFDLLIYDPVGKQAILIAFLLWLFGVVLLLRFSKVEF